MSKALHRCHYWRKAGDSTGAQVVTVGKTTGEDNTIIAREVSFLVPKVIYLLPQDFAQHIMTIPITPGTGENNYTRFH